MLRHPAREGGGLPRPRSRRVIGVTAVSTAALMGLGAAIAGPASAQIRFDVRRNVPMPVIPGALATGDFDGDGRVDVAAVGSGSPTVVVRLGTGPGTWGPAASFPAGPNPGAIVAADFNGDGDPDLAVTNGLRPEGTVSVLLGGAGGTFSAASTLPAGDLPNSVHAADLDGDDDPELVVTNAFSEDVRVYPGAGAGGFGVADVKGVGVRPDAVATGDFDGDARLDMAVGNELSDSVSVFLGAEGGGLGPRQDFAASDGPFDVEAGDLDDDGDLDLVAVGIGDPGDSLPDEVSVMLGNGDGTFGAPADHPVGDRPGALELGHLDGDDDLDVVVTNSASASVTVLRGGPGASLLPEPALASEPGPQSPVLADVVGDASPDLLIAQQSGGFSSYRNISGNRAPVAGDDAFAVAEDGFLGESVLANDSDPDGDAVTPTLVEGPVHGHVNLGLNGSFGYTPDRDYAGPDTFTYRLTDEFGAVGPTATVAITVEPVNDPPEAFDDEFSTSEDTPLPRTPVGLLDNDLDPDSPVLGFARLLAPPSKGTIEVYADGEFTYTPFPDATGTDVINYVVTDGEFEDIATVRITIIPVNDGPPVVADDSYSTERDRPLLIPAPGPLLNDSDPDGTTLRASGFSWSGAAEVLLTQNGELRYTPPPGFVGVDAVTYTATDGELSSTGQILITVTGPDPDLVVGDATVVEKGPLETSTLRFSASLSAPAAQDVTFRWTTHDNTASAPDDYTARVDRLARIPTGETSVTLSVPVIGDDLSEGDETIDLTAGAVSGAFAVDTEAAGTIRDDDPPPEVSIGDVAIGEGNSGTRNAVFPVTLSAPALRSVRVGWSTLDGTATAGSDYAARLDRFVTFLPGETAKTVAVPVTGDAVLEDDETFAVSLTPGSYGIIADGDGTAVIVDEDFPEPTISVGDVTVVEGNTGSKSAVLTVTLSNQSTRRVDVGWSTADGTALAGLDYTAKLAQTLAFSAGQTSRTISVPILGDRVTETTEGLTVQLSGTGYGSVADGEGAITITDND